LQEDYERVSKKILVTLTATRVPVDFKTPA